MRAVVDTNVLVSGLLRADGPPARVLADLGSSALRPVVCDVVMAEYGAVLRRPRLRITAADAADAAGVLELLRLTAVRVMVPAYGGAPALPDPGAWPFVACALAADCPVVTGNRKHFPPRLGVRIMKARQWVERDPDR
jgi:predicted nucleic acid-binding protein